jgi:hypothetical protein
MIIVQRAQLQPWLTMTQSDLRQHLPLHPPRIELLFSFLARLSRHFGIFLPLRRTFAILLAAFRAFLCGIHCVLRELGPFSSLRLASSFPNCACGNPSGILYKKHKVILILWQKIKCAEKEQTYREILPKTFDLAYRRLASSNLISLIRLAFFLAHISN